MQQSTPAKSSTPGRPLLQAGAADAMAPHAPHGSHAQHAQHGSRSSPLITRVETVLVDVPLRQRTITDSQSSVDSVEFVQVRIDTDAGVMPRKVGGSTSNGREQITVWASFDGGRTWPAQRLVYAGPSAYSNLGVGRAGTKIRRAFVT